VSDTLRSLGTLRVLILEDSPTDAKLVAKELQQTGCVIELERVETAEAMCAALDQRSWDLIISDWSMPKFSAPAGLAILKERALDLPFIIVSGTIGEDKAVEAMRSGAHDYILKDALGRLTPAIERELREYKERVARRQAEAEAQKYQRESEALRKRVQDQRLTVDLFNHALAHDLREPVRTVRSFAELICAGQLGEERREDYMRLIRDAGDRMAMLIDTVAAYTDLDGAIAPKREVFDLHDAASDAAANLVALFSDHGATVNLGALPFVTANRVQVTQVLQNLMSNAASHSPVPVQIWIQAEAEGGSVRVVVRDNGPGISPKHQREIFAPFRRFNRENHHSGLGLAIAQKIVEAHGGEIGCTSVPGEGSSFHFTLPGVLASTGDAVPVKPAVAPAMIESAPPTLANVLIVDDHEGEIVLARVHLTEPGAMRCNLLVARDGAEGLAMVREQSARKDPVDLILLDINMPGMGGFEMLEALAEDSMCCRIPVVMCSGSKREEDKIRSRELGAVAYLVKTVRFEQLKPVIAALDGVRLTLDENGARLLVRAA